MTLFINSGQSKLWKCYWLRSNWICDQKKKIASSQRQLLTRIQISEIPHLSSIEEGALNALVIDSSDVLMLSLYKFYQSSVVPLQSVCKPRFPIISFSLAASAFPLGFIINSNENSQ